MQHWDGAAAPIVGVKTSMPSHEMGYNTRCATLMSTIFFFRRFQPLHRGKLTQRNEVRFAKVI